MKTKITKGVKVSVETFYQPKYSRPAFSEYAFAYRVTIENTSDTTIQLLSRKWQIFDSSEGHSTVKGKGVVGQRPVLEPNSEYQYASGCHLKSEMGSMHGKYVFVNKANGEKFEVRIPRFYMIAPLKLN